MPMNILHLPTPVGGNSWGLSQGERALGLGSDVLVRFNNWFDYKADINLNLAQYSKPMALLTLLKTFFDIRNKYDVFHFNFGSSLIDFPKYGLLLSELPFYPKNKKLIMTYNGCDIRQKYPTMKREKIAACHETLCYGGMCNSGALDKLRRKKLKKALQYVDHIFALNPDLLYFLPDTATFLPYTCSNWSSISEERNKIDKKIRIVHAPTQQVTKGTKYIIAAVEKLKKKYTNIEFILVENVPNKKALEIYKSAHIFISQVLSSGWYGVVAVEAMKMGIPTFVHIRESNLKFVPNEMANDLLESIVNVDPFNLEQKLEAYLQNPALLNEKGQAGIEYVNKWHNPIDIAKKVRDVYEQ